MWFFIGLAAVLVVAIATYTVARVSSRLSLTESVSVYDPSAGADFIMENLPQSIVLDRTEVEFLVGCHLDYLRVSGIANQGLADRVALEMAEKTPNPLADEDQAVDFVLALVQESDFELEALQVVVVLDLSTQYMAFIGAIGDESL